MWSVSATLYRDLGNSFEAAYTFEALGHPNAAIGRIEQARAAWREAQRLYREQGRHDDAERVQRELDDLDRDTDDQP